MELHDAIDKVDILSDDQVIFARKPWTLAAEADVGKLDADHRVPSALAKMGLAYFLEVSVAQEVLEVFGKRKPSIDEKCALLMFYAENDAYPQWVYSEE